MTNGHHPTIGIFCDLVQDGLHQFHRVGDKYIRALMDHGPVTPLLIPALGNEINVDWLISSIDGVLLTGAYSNIERHRYGLSPAPPGENQDPARDSSTLPLIPKLVHAGIPLFAICRGFQEVNVAYGGTLHPRLHKVSGRHDHREDTSQPVDVQYGPAHKVKPTEGGYLQSLLGGESFMVNSIHGQGIDQLGEGLSAEARAEDTTIEALRITKASDFALAVQWHPEWKSTENQQSRALFGAFIGAARKRMQQRLTIT